MKNPNNLVSTGYDNPIFRTRALEDFSGLDIDEISKLAEEYGPSSLKGLEYFLETANSMKEIDKDKIVKGPSGGKLAGKVDFAENEEKDGYDSFLSLYKGPDPLTTMLHEMNHQGQSGYNYQDPFDTKEAFGGEEEMSTRLADAEFTGKALFPEQIFGKDLKEIAEDYHNRPGEYAPSPYKRFNLEDYGTDFDGDLRYKPMKFEALLNYKEEADKFNKKEDLFELMPGLKDLLKR